MSVDSDDGKHVTFKIGYEDSFALPFVNVKYFIQCITYNATIDTNISQCNLFFQYGILKLLTRRK